MEAHCCVTLYSVMARGHRFEDCRGSERPVSSGTTPSSDAPSDHVSIAWYLGVKSEEHGLGLEPHII